MDLRRCNWNVVDVSHFELREIACRPHRCRRNHFSVWVRSYRHRWPHFCGRQQCANGRSTPSQSNFLNGSSTTTWHTVHPELCVHENDGRHCKPTLYTISQSSDQWSARKCDCHKELGSNIFLLGAIIFFRFFLINASIELWPHLAKTATWRKPDSVRLSYARWRLRSALVHRYR